MASQKPRIIFHVDMNSFYASVEIANDPMLKGKPIAIAGRVEDRRGIVVTSSYEARARGVKTTMTVGEARRYCPDLLVMPPNFPLYKKTSADLFEYLKSFQAVVEKVSIDEGYMDISEIAGEKHPLEWAKELQNGIYELLKLPCSIGIAPNKFLAKMASDMKKPRGITVLRKRHIPQLLWPLNVGEMHGVGPKTAEKLKQKGIHTIGDLAKQNKAYMAEWLGSQGEKLYDRANGYDNRPVDPDAWHHFKSISQSTTLPTDTTDDQVVWKTLSRLSGNVALKAKAQHVVGYRLSLTIKYNDFKTATRHLSTKQPMSDSKDIAAKAFDLYIKNHEGRPIRLLGITLEALHPFQDSTKQLDLFSYERDAKHEPIVTLIDHLNDKFGKNIIRLGSNQNNDKKK